MSKTTVVQWWAQDSSPALWAHGCPLSDNGNPEDPSQQLVVGVFGETRQWGHGKFSLPLDSHYVQGPPQNILGSTELTPGPLLDIPPALSPDGVV